MHVSALTMLHTVSHKASSLQLCGLAEVTALLTLQIAL